MPAPLQIHRMGHLNHLTTDLEATRAHYEELFGGRFLMHIGENPMTAGFLVDVGGEIIEALIPKVLDKAEGKQLARLGPHYSSVELLVPDLDAAREAVTSRGIRLLLDKGLDFLTVAADTDGVLLQVYDGDWHSDPPPPQFSAPKRSLDWWRDEHPIGMRRMRHLTFATDDVDRSRDFWIELCGGTELYREARPHANAVAVGLDIGIRVELVAPTGGGDVADFLARFGNKIRSITYEVVDLERTRDYFGSRGIELVVGDLPDSLMLRAEDNRGGIVQFVA